MAAAVLGGLVLSSGPTAAENPMRTAGAKVLVTDGHVVHDVGLLQNNVTNFGLIGSRPTVPTPYSEAPSALWGGIDYLWAAGFWVGGVVLGETRVSTGQYEVEIMASDAPGDSIFATAFGAPGGNRYPWSGADDDGDGVEDEDPLDGLDNDGDGLVDEDFAACADQQFRCVMRDDTPLAVASYPDHVPMNLEVVQESYQWDDPLAADFIGYEYQVTNRGVTDIDGLHCGIFADFDIEIASDDMAGSWTGGYVQASDGSWVPVSLGYTRDAASSNPAPGWAGFVLCGTETDAAAGLAGSPLDLHSLNIFSGNDSFEHGGDPTNDSERYQLLGTPGVDPDPLPTAAADYRFLVSGPEVPTLAPGETVVFRFALVLGNSESDLLTHAGEAVRTAIGEYYDRDGDPGNGAEFHVPWLRPEDAPVPAVTGRLKAGLTEDAVDLAFEVPYGGGGRALVARRPSTGVPARTWVPEGLAGRIVDDDPVGWPRTYDLKLAAEDGSDLLLDTVEVPGPLTAVQSLEAAPNPFNPRLTIRYAVPGSGSARLEVLDLRGREVRVLFDEDRPAGAGRIDWDGRDDAGRAMASGVYLLRLSTARAVTRARVTLVR